MAYQTGFKALNMSQQGEALRILRRVAEFDMAKPRAERLRELKHDADKFIAREVLPNFGDRYTCYVTTWDNEERGFIKVNAKDPVVASNKAVADMSQQLGVSTEVLTCWFTIEGHHDVALMV